MAGFRGSKEQRPAAITTTADFIVVFREVVRSHFPSLVFSNDSTLSPRVNPGLKGSIYFIKLSINSPANTEG